MHMEFSLYPLLVVSLSGLAIGWLAEFLFELRKWKKVIIPLFVNVQMYGCTAVVAYFLYALDAPFYVVIPLLLIFTTGIEFITGSIFLKFKHSHLWDYSMYAHNYKGLICLRFSLYWVGLALVYYYLGLPLLFRYIL
jgi:uncharacterized protein